ncbi:MAG: hypothetical protein JNM94_17140 [Phycisphaerae bacterium]|nr:hypothetical protein [Phycisphaerae bacterium]
MTTDTKTADDEKTATAAKATRKAGAKKAKAERPAKATPPKAKAAPGKAIGTTANATVSAKAAPKTAKPKKAEPTRLSALDAAATVLASAKEPMRAADIVKAMAERGLWSTPNGKTPEATVYAAILREIGAKGKDARFRKTDRGLFTAGNGKGA